MICDDSGCVDFGALQARLGTARNTVAILARERAIISWVEEVTDGSGFAFGVLQTGTRKLGVFSSQAPKGATGASMRMATC